MRRLLFIDDDQTELEAFREIVEGSYEYHTIHWPSASAILFSAPPPNIFVSDLYLPSYDGDRTPTNGERQGAAKAAERVAQEFSSLYTAPSTDDKVRLKETMRAIGDAYAVLKMQWSALGQSPDNGVALLARVKAQYPEVPFVFYSRKINPEDVIRVLRAGAVDAIRKDALTKSEMLARLDSAQKIYQRGEVQEMRKRGLSANLTSFSDP